MSDRTKATIEITDETEAMEAQRAWVAFAAAILPQFIYTAPTAAKADEMLAEWRMRFGSGEQ